MVILSLICAGFTLASLCLWYSEMESLWLVQWEFTGGNFQGTNTELAILVFRGLVAGLGGWLWQQFLSSKYKNRTQTKLALAGTPRHLSGQELWGWRLVLAFGGFATIQFLESNLILAGLASYLFSRLPYFWLSYKASQRETAIRRALPGVLDLLVICTGAGLTFDAAINVLIQKSPPNPLIDEFNQVLHHMRMGESRRHALRSMADRCRQPDVRSVCATLIQADELGTSINSTLLLLARQIRLNQAHRAEARANRAPVQMLFPLIFFIFPSLLLVLFGPVFLGGSF